MNQNFEPPPIYMYLSVHKKETGKAIKRGAMFDHKSKCWYVPQGLSAILFEQWFPSFSKKSSQQMRLKSAQEKNKLGRENHAANEVLRALKIAEAKSS